MTLFDKIREAVFRDREPPVIRKPQVADNPTEVVGGVEVFKLGAAADSRTTQASSSEGRPPPSHAYGQNRRHRGR